MFRFKTLVVMVIVMAVAMSVSAADVKVWKEVGLNPITTSLNETLKKMSLTDDDREFVKNNFPDTVYIQDMIFTQGSEGPGKVFSPVYTEYAQPTKALVWKTGRVNIYMIQGCNNVAWSPTCPEVVEEIVPLVETPVESGDSDWFAGMPALFQTFLWAVLAILIFLLLSWVVIRLTQNVSTPIPPTTPVHPEPEPVSATNVDKLVQLRKDMNDLQLSKVERDRLYDRVKRGKDEISSEVTSIEADLESMVTR